MTAFKYSIAIVVLVVLLSCNVEAQRTMQFRTSMNCYRDGCDFNSPSNWVGSVAPSLPTDTAVIDYRGTNPLSGGQVQNIYSKASHLQIGSLTVLSDENSPIVLVELGNVNIAGNLTIGTFVTVQPAKKSTLTVAGNLTILYGGSIYTEYQVTLSVLGYSIFNQSTVQIQPSSYFTSNGAYFLGGQFTLETQSTMALYGNTVINNSQVTTYDYSVVQVDNLLLTNRGSLQVTGNFLATGNVQLSLYSSIQLDFNSSIFIGRGASVTLGELDIQGSLTLSDYIPYTDIIGPGSIAQLILNAQKKGIPSQITAYIGDVDIGNITSTGTPTTADLTFDGTISSIGSTPVSINNAIITVSNSANLNITGSVSLSGPLSQIVIQNRCSFSLYGANLTSPNITTGADSSVELVGASIYTGDLHINGGSSLLVSKSSIIGNVYADSTKVVLGQGVEISGGVYLTTQSSINLAVASLSTSPTSASISTHALELNDGSLSLWVQDPTQLQVGSTYYLVSSVGNILINPTQCAISFTLPNNLSYSFQVTLQNDINYLVFNVESN
ncbi:hypothetical protein DFA_06182 [Cavenderia fasciculata]|uniref:Uncharacterized protein n=1 Tax=Cavenderia fasciculata TaxID=261658 RepID=F4PKC0_CACFS|nr:uncharacterized protein DFA_06182 [Cavenderia fasciculata]EGG24044.1 hypothetical protein DFA_06182 [Cavenderia fasciculata]|eukprot:XP_004361895.1 hypothetical protein DFA_06182 [Cavenderia fasciculata]